MNDSHLALDGFNIFHINREGMGGSGVGLYIRDTFSVDVLAGSDVLYDNTPEFPTIFQLPLNLPTYHTSILP